MNKNLQKEKGFTLLEVLVAIVMLVISLSVVIKIYTNYIKDYDAFLQDINDIQQVKKYIYNIKEGYEELPSVKQSYESAGYGIRKKIYIYKDKPVIIYYIIDTVKNYTKYTKILYLKTIML
ncbi:type II secretion system protein [Venenivibrio stagnispumantis]|nr:type II secretion system GspH family protein [Venenivibrio stagnispumantis]